MRRGANPGKAKVKARFPVARKPPKNDASGRRELEQRLAESLEREKATAEILQEKDRALTEALQREAKALEQQTATAEILRVIASTPADSQPVFEAIVNSAQRLMAGKSTVLLLRRDPQFVVGAYAGPALADLPDQVRAAPLDRKQNFPSRAILDAEIVHVPDWEADDVPAHERVVGRSFGIRAGLMVPLLHEGQGIGALVVTRGTAGPYDEKEIALLRSFADQAVIAIENVRLFQELEARNSDLTATSDILQVISRSPTDVQPVFDTIAERAMRLCDAAFGAVLMFDGALIHLNALANVNPEGVDALRQAFPVAPSRGTTAGRVILTGDVVQIPDVLGDPEYQLTGPAKAAKFRCILGVPMLHQGRAIGAIHVTRPEPGTFSQEQIKLLKTFADQAVIAIENVRLFKETNEALEQQSASSEILRVIASSPTDARPVFDAIAKSAWRLLGGHSVSVSRLVGDELRLMAFNTTSAAADVVLQSVYPMRLDQVALAARVMRERTTAIVTDIETDPDVTDAMRDVGRARGFRSFVWMPMVRDDVAIGIIAVTRSAPGGFADRDVTLLQTFADQAVIAIENVRLFTELEEKNRALTQAHGRVTEALEQQTATSEILRTIAQAQTDVQPVFDTIVRSAAQLCQAAVAAVFRTDGRMLHVLANHGSSPEALAGVRARYPRPLDMNNPPSIAVLTRSVVHVPDTEEPSAGMFARQVGRELQFRSVLVVPMLREGEAVGAILVCRREPGRFSDREEELLKTFADQAVIAVENVRLFKELEARTAALTRSVEQLTALGEVGRAVSSTLNLETVLTTIVSRAVQLSGLDGGVVFEYDEDAEEFVQRAATETGGTLAEVRRTTRIRKGEGALGRTAITLEPVQIPDIGVPGAYESRLRENLIVSGVRAILAVPMVREGRLIGCLGVTRNQPGEFPAETIELLRTFATQSALAIQNARLFHEIEDKSRQLEAASRHKSEFLANMSHELRTPLNAIIGFSEVLAERMFGELNEKQDEYLKDIYASGQHLLSLINDILDLSKIEAGRMELEAADFDLPSAIDNALILVRERAGRRGITLGHSVDEGFGTIRGDERKVKQVFLNLLSNALKFTPEGGRIDVSVRVHDGVAEIAVADTGVGIAPEDQEAVFEEFRQVGTADKKVEGTGLGLALSRKFIELHGGRIWVKSAVGQGSTFTFTLPVRRED